jgi:hypothetical protein
MYRPTAAHPPDAFRQRIRFAMASSLKRRRSTQSKRLIPFHRNRFHPTTIPTPQSSKQTLINETEGVRLDRLAAELGSFRFRLADRLIPDSETDPTRYDACNQVPTDRLEGGKAARCVDKKSSIITDPCGSIHILEVDDDAPSGPGAAFAVGPASGFSEGLASRRVARRAQIRPVRPIIDISRR